MRRKKEENKTGERTLNLAAMSESNTNRTHSADGERVPTTKYEIGKSEREDDMRKRGGGGGGGDGSVNFTTSRNEEDDEEMRTWLSEFHEEFQICRAISTNSD